MNDLVFEVFNLCLTINKEKKGHAFFDYHGHVDKISVNVNPCNQNYQDKSEHVDFLDGKYGFVYLNHDDAEEVISRLIDDLQTIVEREL